MKTQQEYIRDITEIRSIMERSTRFLSLTGWSGILAGIYALAGAWVAWNWFFEPSLEGLSTTAGGQRLLLMGGLALAVLLLAVGTAILLSWRRASKKKERLWNAPARRLVMSMATPLVSGGLLIVILAMQGLVHLALPLMLLFYGLALISASRYTFEDAKYLGLAQIALGLAAAWEPRYGLLLWALGFGLLHIVYGIYMHLKYEK